MRTLGDVYVKEEFRQNIEKADSEQFDKFLYEWDKYYNTIRVIPDRSETIAKRIITQQEDDPRMSELNDEQKETLDDFKDFIYDSNKYK